MNQTVCFLGAALHAEAVFFLEPVILLSAVNYSATDVNPWHLCTSEPGLKGGDYIHGLGKQSSVSAV